MLYCVIYVEGQTRAGDERMNAGEHCIGPQFRSAWPDCGDPGAHHMRLVAVIAAVGCVGCETDVLVANGTNVLPPTIPADVFETLNDPAAAHAELCDHDASDNAWPRDPNAGRNVVIARTGAVCGN